MISQSKLDFFIENNINALFIGRHGTGKTSSVIEAFNRHKLNWLYFSVSTMDPWVDFVGVPTPQTDERGLTYLDLVRPKAFAEDKVEAIFLDEYNRGVDKVRNAVLELIQFKSINGKKFNNLKVVWAAINPDDDISQYDVAKLDWAQKDRFQAHIEVPYEIDKSYFLKKYAANGPELIDNIVAWWDGLDENVRNCISPRRVDYIMQMYMLGGDIKDVVPQSANTTYLLSVLEKGSIEGRLETIMNNQDVKAAQKLMKNDTEFTEAIKFILKDEKKVNFFLPLMNEEKLTALVQSKLSEPEELSKITSLYYSETKCRDIIRKFYENFETKHNIQESIQHPQSDKYGVSADKVRKFNANRAPIEGFIEKVNTLGCNREATLQERKDMYDYIEANIGLNDKGKVGNAAVAILFFGKLLKYLSVELGQNVKDVHATLKSQFPNIIGIVNECLKVLPDDAIDIRKSPYWKMVSIQIINNQLEEYIWIPN